MTQEFVETRIVDRVLYVTIRRATKLNTLSKAVLGELKRAFETAAENRELVGAVLTGEGERAFAAGGDLTEFDSARTPEAAIELTRIATAALDAIREFPVPVIAAVNGDALGGGAEMAAACDMRVIAEHAHIGFIQGSLGISTGWGGGDDLRRIVGSGRALRILVEARKIDAAEAMAVGLADAVAGKGALDTAVENELATLRKRPAQVMRAFKAVTRPPRTSEQAAKEFDHFVECWLHDDHWTVHDQIVARLRKKT